ncbi:MAG: orotidine 5'-phosphate decarboxylase [Armatimonadota bacterium]|nr:MAG: orotidine 5'-phosphate decarboxylase [Armatimonadota bacterium]
MQARQRILIALDTSDAEQAVRWVRLLSPYVGGFKVGLELVHAAGFGIFDRLREAGAERIFYDAKLHDIPNTVARAVRAIAQMGVWMVNVHASGGRAMMQAAVEAARSVSEPPLLIAVTVLTSLSSQELREQVGTRRGAVNQVVHLASMAKESGMDGVVASVQEARALRRRLGEGFLIVTPGIRLAGDSAGDQRRVATPSQAVRSGADYLVVGRSVTADIDPVRKVLQVVEEMEPR